ncbi:hypothetical protein GWI33_003635 [Rhynchophorus ferrugineus]|nr:hypothetical protein GWI33_003635 [Rhynchophorus ferrugineus]
MKKSLPGPRRGRRGIDSRPCRCHDYETTLTPARRVCLPLWPTKNPPRDPTPPLPSPPGPRRADGGVTLNLLLVTAGKNTLVNKCGG